MVYANPYADNLAGPLSPCRDDRRHATLPDVDEFMALIETGGRRSPWSCIFARPDASAQRPAEITKYFTQLVANLGLPPIRLHDLRHGAATRALEADVDIEVVQDLLGHSTRDNCASVSPRPAKEAAEKAAKMIPCKAG